MSNDVTLLIQGGVVDNHGLIDINICKYINISCQSLPRCQVVLSTWSMSKTNFEQLRSQLDKRVSIVLNDDPGVLYKKIGISTYKTNINRMIVSTKAGLANISTKYTIKIRTDSYLSSSKILEEIRRTRYFSRNAKFNVLEEYVVNCNLFARHHNSYLPFLYHPGDILLAGLTSDLIRIFDINLCQDDVIEIFNHWHSTCSMKLVPEQYIWASCIKKYFDSDFSYQNFNVTRTNKAMSEHFYMNNFIPISCHDLDFIWPKFSNVYHSKGKHSIYTYEDWTYYNSKNVIGLKVKKSNYQRFFRPFINFFMKGIFMVRTVMLRNKFIRHLAYSIFVKRGC